MISVMSFFVNYSPIAAIRIYKQCVRLDHLTCRPIRGYCNKCNSGVGRLVTMEVQRL